MRYSMKLVAIPLMTVFAAIPARATAVSGSTAANTRPDTAIQVLLKAMREGDDASTMRIFHATTDPAIHVVAAMVAERIHFHLDASTRDAQLCEQDLIGTRPGIALLCGEFVSGNQRLAGKYADALDTEHGLVAHFRGHHVDGALVGIQAFLDTQAKLSPLSYENLPAGIVSMPLKQAWSPTFDARGNGHAFRLELDTGAQGLVLGADLARRLGVQFLDRKARINGWLSRGIAGQLGILDKLDFGGISLRHVPVVIVPQDFALIGVNLMAPLGAIRITHRTLTIYGMGATAPACNTQILTGSNVWGTQLRLFPEVLVNDKPQAVELDTGAARYLLGSRQALDSVDVLHRGQIRFADIGGRHALANADSAKVKLTIAGQPIMAYFFVLRDSDSPHGITLGAGSLRDMDFLLDFRRGAECFVLHPDLH